MPRKRKTLEVEDEQLRDYEMVLILSPEATEGGSDAATDKVNQLITERGGSLSNVEQWGKRKLAYPIKHFMEGGYVLTRFQLKPKLIKELEENLRISEEVVRHLVVKLGS
jgi:small subunit ribosomal protein S6